MSLTRAPLIVDSHDRVIWRSSTYTNQQKNLTDSSLFTMSTDPVLAAPSSDCCLKGFVHAGEPKGEMISIAGIPTYITKPPSGSANKNHVVLYFPDVWGVDGSFQFNGKLLMDYFASEGNVARVSIPLIRRNWRWYLRLTRLSSPRSRLFPRSKSEIFDSFWCQREADN